MTSSFDSDSATKVKIILKGRDDWRNWILNIKEYAERLDVWDHFNPEDSPIIQRPGAPVKPTRPAELSETNFRAYQLDLQDYKDARNNIAKVEEAIKTSIAIHVQPLIEEKRRFEILKALKEQYEPTEDEMEEKALRQYKAVIKRSPRKGKINAWIEDFDHAYLAIKRLNMSESQDKHVQKDFLRSIEAVDPLYSRLHYSNIRNTTYRNLLSDFRTYLANSGRDDDSAVAHTFATLNGQNDTPTDAQKPQDTGKKEEGSPYCVCGLRHRMDKCWQLHPDLRPPNWKPNSRAMKKIKDFAAGSSTQAQMVRSIIEKNWKQGDERPQEYHVMALSFNASLDIPLKNCFIIDTGSCTHVCNEISRLEELNQSSGGQLHAGDSTIEIQGFGKVRIRPNCGGEKGDKEIVLTNIAFVPGLHTNILSAQKLKQAGYDFSMARNTISRNGRVVFRVEEHSSGLWIIEKNKSTHYGFAMIKLNRDPRRSARPSIVADDHINSAY